MYEYFKMWIHLIHIYLVLGITGFRIKSFKSAEVKWNTFVLLGCHYFRSKARILKLYTDVNRSMSSKNGNRSVQFQLRNLEYLWTYLFYRVQNYPSQRPRGLRCRSGAARLLKLWVRIPQWGTDVCFLFFMLSGRSVWDKLITCPEESYRMDCEVVCDLETSWTKKS
jgi:hypothetical protein